MINLQSAILSHVSVHYVGNQGADESLFLSTDEIDLSNEFLADILTESFTKPFQDKSEFLRFTHSSDLQLNEMYSFVNQVFMNKNTFHEVSKNMAKHLFEKTQHPKVKGGEMYVAFWENACSTMNFATLLVCLKRKIKTFF